MKKVLITLTVALIVGWMTAPAFAWEHHNGKDQAIFNKLTNDQKTQFWELHQQWMDDSKETRSAMMAKHEELLTLMENSKPDESRIQSLSDDILGMQKILADKRIVFAMKAKQISPSLNLMASDSNSMGMGMGMSMSKRMGSNSNPSSNVDGDQ